MDRLLLFSVLAALGATVSHAANVAPRKPVSHPQSELAAAAQIAVDRGVHVELPPHISTLLGLTKEEACGVMQGILRSSQRTQGFEVTEKNHNDIVIFTVDETTKDQTFYLTSPSGALRRVLSVKQGVGNVVKPMKADVEAFQKEKKMWEERLAVQTSAR